jgi:hypothetical protein
LIVIFVDIGEAKEASMRSLEEDKKTMRELITTIQNRDALGSFTYDEVDGQVSNFDR